LIPTTLLAGTSSDPGASATIHAGHFIALPGRLSAATLRDLVEDFEIGPRLSILKETRSDESRHPFRHRRGHKLVNARTILAAQPLDRLFERSRQPQRVCFVSDIT
jgi:hypothetical protein